MNGRSRTDPLVSVVIIFRDAERFLNEAIASVFAQTYSHWELLLVDDGSQDTSAAIAREWVERGPECVRNLAHSGNVNRGMSASRNLGVRNARGQLIAFLDSDDAWFPNTLTDQVALLEAWPAAALVYGPIQWWYSWTDEPARAECDVVERLGVTPDALVAPPLLLPLFLRNRAAVPSGFLVRREIYERVGGFEDAFTGEYEDQVFCAKVCLQEPVFASGRCWYRYRQHPNSCVALSQQTGESRAARVAFLTWLTLYLANRRVTSARVWAAVCYEFWRWKFPRQYRLWRRGQQAGRRLLRTGRSSAQRGASMTP